MTIELFVNLYEAVYFVIRMDYGGMVFAPEVATNFRKACFGMISSNEHGDLTREGDGSHSLFALQVADTNLEMLGYRSHNCIDGYAALSASKYLFKYLFGHGQVNGPAGDGRVC